MSHDCLAHYPHGGLVPWTCPVCDRVWTVSDSRFVQVDGALGALRRICDQILLARRKHEAPLFDGGFFAEGFPAEEREAIQEAVGADGWEALTHMQLDGRSGVLEPLGRLP